MAKTEPKKPEAEDNIPSTDSAAKVETDSAAASAKPEGTAEPAMMQVPVDKMQKILDTMEALQKKDEARDEEIAILRDSVSSSKLDEAEDKRKVKGPPKAQVMIYENKLVVGWKMEKNELIYNPVNMMVPVSENLKISLTFADGEESGVIPYVDFVRTKERGMVSKVGENGIMWVVKFDDPNIRREDLEIDPQFLNP